MIWECTECGLKFDTPKIYTETHGLDFPPYEEYSGCPYCGGYYEELKEDESN